MPVKKTTAKWFEPFSLPEIIIILSAVLTFVLALYAYKTTGNGFDKSVFAVISPMRSETLTGLMIYVSFLGNTSFLIPANIILLIVFVVRKDKWTAVRVAAIAITSVAIMSFMKRSFGRVRPPDPLIEGVTNYSFPSGHAFMTVAFYGFLISWVLAAERSYQRKIREVALLVILLWLIGFSRVYLRVHYATDVLAGWSVGVIWLLISLVIIDELVLKYKARPLARD